MMYVISCKRALIHIFFAVEKEFVGEAVNITPANVSAHDQAKNS